MIIDQVCITCKYYKEQKCEILGEIYDPKDFICDFYRQKRTGAFRRKMSKHRKDNNQ